MPLFLGLDTSNYTTSAALFDSESGEIKQAKKLLPVKSGELGLRQSDAVFHHTKQLPEVLEELFEGGGGEIAAVAVSNAPRSREDSYMPCFLCGVGMARGASSLLNIPLYKTSHQTGHIMAALYSCGRQDYMNRSFLAFHVSGGTTDALLITPDSDKLIAVEELASSLDLHAGQAVDRIGVALGLAFPCGRELEALALKSTRSYKIKPVTKNGSICLSGVENKCGEMIKNGESSEDTALYCLEYIKYALEGMTKAALSRYGELPLVYAGGVMSNSIIRKYFSEKYNADFAEPQYSCDNAAGIALYAYHKWSRSR